MTKLAVVHIHGALPGDLLDIDAEGVALLNMVVQHSGQQVVSGADGVEVTSEVEVDVLHRNYLCITAASSTALHAEHGAQRRLTQSDNSILANLAETVSQTHRGGGLAFASGGRGDGSDQNELAVRLVRKVFQHTVVNFGLVVAILLDVLLVHTAFLGDFCNLKRSRLLSNFDIGFHSFASSDAKISLQMHRQGTRGSWR